MSETKTRAKKRAAKEVDTATPSASASKKARKRTLEQHAASAEATRRTRRTGSPRGPLKRRRRRTRKRLLKIFLEERRTGPRGSGLLVSLDRDAVCKRAFEKVPYEDSYLLSGERTPTTARKLKNEWRSESVLSNTSSPKKHQRCYKAAS